MSKSLVIHHRREGGQSQHSALLELDANSDRIQNALEYQQALRQTPADAMDEARRAPAVADPYTSARRYAPASLREMVSPPRQQFRGGGNLATPVPIGHLGFDGYGSVMEESDEGKCSPT